MTSLPSHPHLHSLRASRKLRDHHQSSLDVSLTEYRRTLLEVLKHYETDECIGKHNTATRLRATHEALEQEVIKLQGALEKCMARLHKCKRERTALARQMNFVQSQAFEIQRHNNPLPLDMSTAKDRQIRVLRRKLARATGTGLRSPASLTSTSVSEEL